MSDLVLNALRRNRVIAEKSGNTEWADRIDARLGALDRTEEALEPAPEAELEPEPVDAELEQLLLEAEAAGVKVDGRWGVDRLREEIQAATESEENA